MATTPSLATEIVTGPPAATAVTRPPSDTVAIAGIDDVHARSRSVSTSPAPLRSVATSWTVFPVSIVVSTGVRSMDATGGRVTVTCAVAAIPSLVTMIDTGPPGATPMTMPVVDTVAVVGSDDVHCGVRSVSTAPAALLRTATMRTLSPTTMDGAEGVTTIDATEGLGGGSGGVLLSEHATVAPRTTRVRQRASNDACCLTVLGIYRDREVPCGDAVGERAVSTRVTVKLETPRNSTGRVHQRPGMLSNRYRSKCSRLRQESLT